MAISVCEVSITQSPLDLPARENNAAAGAIVDFWGIVRGLEEGREIAGIEYEAHGAMAEHQMRSLAETAIGQFGLTKIIIRHRIGFVPATEASIVVRVESPRRSAAFSANQWIMDELKRTVPIWKHPVFKDGNVSAGETADAKLQRRLGPPSARA
jgi:molybdopterin synthase catalytic subunit